MTKGLAILYLALALVVFGYGIVTGDHSNATIACCCLILSELQVIKHEVL